MKSQIILLAVALMTAAVADAQLAETTTTMVATPNPTHKLKSVNITVTVSSPQGVPSGTITWNDGTGSVIEFQLTNGWLNFEVGGIYHPFAFLPGSSYTWTATYNGNANFLPSSATHVEVVTKLTRGDLDGDGRADILLRDSLGCLGRWCMNGPVIVAGSARGCMAAGATTVSIAGDFSGDGLADVLNVWPSGYPKILGSDIPPWQPIPGCNFGGCIDPLQGVSDFDGDGSSDLLMRDASGTVAMWTFSRGGMNNLTLFFTKRIVAHLDLAYTIVGVDDFDGDGKGDILLRYSNGAVGMWFMDREVIRAGGYVESPGLSYHVVGTGDFDADGKADILLGDEVGDLGIWFMDGPTIARGAFVSRLPAGYRVVAVNDYDGDGKCDILLRDANGAVGMWLMDGATIRLGAFVESPGLTYEVY